MTPNELLLWLSARREGSWPQFRGAVEALEIANAGDETEDASLPLHQRVRFNLERLGHVEFDAAECEDGWRVVPPVLALTHNEGAALGVLCGARTPKLLERIERSGRALSFERISVADCPDIIRIGAAQSDLLIKLAGQEGLSFQLDTPTALLSHVPPVDSIKGWLRLPLPAAGKDWDVRQFVIEKKMMKWRIVSLQDANAPHAQGLFRFTRFQIPQYFLREGHETMTLPGVIGKYRILSQYRRRVMKYDRKERQLTFPAIFRPPPLTERALIMCSGFPPAVSAVHGRTTLTYKDIPEEVAGIAAEVLRQDLI